MSRLKSLGKLEAASLLTAVGASLCCITLVFALISGASGFASAFSWINPYRPYLIGISIAVLLFAWYQLLKPAKAKADCCETEKTPFLRGKTFLAIVTVVSVVLMTFPAYSGIFFKNEPKVAAIPASNYISEVKLQISGMDCEACEHHVNGELAKLNEVRQYQTSAALGTSIIKFDTSKIAVSHIVATVNQTGYKVVHQSFKN